MIAVDTNIAVYAHRQDSPWHDRAKRRILELAEGNEVWAIPWPCIFEFVAVVTHRKIYSPPSTAEEAIAQIEAWIESPRLILLGEGDNYWPALKSILQATRVTGALVHDARVAGLCLHHGVKELWSADRDFSRFPKLSVRNPLLD